MKKSELAAVTHCKRYTSNWDYFALAADAFTDAYRQAKQEVYQEQNKNVLFDPRQAGEEVVETEITDGKHQLTIATFNKWKQENSSIELRDAMSVYLKMFDFKDLRITETNGVISFQGTCTRKQEFNNTVIVQD